MREGLKKTTREGERDSRIWVGSRYNPAGTFPSVLARYTRWLTAVAEECEEEEEDGHAVTTVTHSRYKPLHTAVAEEREEEE